jgi:hypothetical protein
MNANKRELLFKSEAHQNFNCAMEFDFKSKVKSEFSLMIDLVLNQSAAIDSSGKEQQA